VRHYSGAPDYADQFIQHGGRGPAHHAGHTCGGQLRQPAHVRCGELLDSRIYLRRRLEEVQGGLQRPGLPLEERQALLHEKVRLKRALMDPGLAETASQAS